MVQITGLHPGSVVVNFTLVFLPNSTRDILSVATALVVSLQSSSQFTVDANSSFVEGTGSSKLAVTRMVNTLKHFTYLTVTYLKGYICKTVHPIAKKQKTAHLRQQFSPAS